MATVILSAIFIILLPLNAVLFAWRWFLGGSSRLKRALLGNSVIVSVIHNWRNWPQRRKKFWANFVLGMMVVILVQLLTPRFAPLYTMSQTFGFDWLNRFEYSEIGSSDKLKPGWNTEIARLIKSKFSSAPTPAKRQDLNYGVIAIGDASQEQWGMPAKTPRNQLAILFKMLFEPENQFTPKMVVVDIDFNFDPDDPNNELLYQFLKTHSETSTVPIVLVRTYELLEQQGVRIRSAVPTFLDKLPKTGSIWWASARVFRNSDNIVRNFVIADVICGPEPELVPSIPVVVDYLSRSEPSDWQELRNSFSSAVSLTTKDCEFNESSWHLSSDGASAVIDYKGVKRELETSRGTNKLILSLNPNNEHPSRLSVPIEAASLINSPDLIDGRALKDRVVIIGATHRNANDVFVTSVGKMQGMYYLLNAIESLHTYGQLHNLNIYLFLLVTAFIVAAFSWIASRFNPVVGLVAAGLVCVFLSPLSFVLYPLGLWFDFGIPLIAIQGNQLVGEMIHSIFQKKIQSHEINL